MCIQRSVRLNHAGIQFRGGIKYCTNAHMAAGREREREREGGKGNLRGEESQPTEGPTDRASFSSPWREGGRRGNTYSNGILISRHFLLL